MATEYLRRVAQGGLIALAITAVAGPLYAGTKGERDFDSAVLNQTAQEVVKYNAADKNDNYQLAQFDAGGEFGATAGGCSFGAKGDGHASTGGDGGDKDGGD